MEHTVGLVLAASMLAHLLLPLHAQGPLLPPGTPAPMMKTLDQIEPRTASSGVSVMNSNASANGSHGFNLGSGCTLSNCSATTNVTHGFNVSHGCALSNCSANVSGSNGFNTENAGALENLLRIFKYRHRD